MYTYVNLQELLLTEATDELRQLNATDEDGIDDADLGKVIRRKRLLSV